MTTLSTTTTGGLAQCGNCGRYGWHSTDRCPTTWRDYADQLTPEQIARLEKWEQKPYGRECDENAHAKSLIYRARDYAQENRWEVEFADVPKPPGATAIHSWGRWDENTVYRTFDGTKRGVIGRIDAKLWGWQHSDGTLSHHCIVLDSGVEKASDGRAELSAAEARELAYDLFAAADELDGLR